MKNAALTAFEAIENKFDITNYPAKKCWESTHRALVDQLNAYNDADSVSKSYKACSIKGMLQVLQFSDNEAIRALAAQADLVFLAIS